MRLSRIWPAIYILALAVRLTLLFGFQRYEIGRPEPVRIALSLAQTGSFADPYSVPTGLTAHSPPLYPVLLAPVYAIWGDTRSADLARMTFSAAVASAEYALLPLVAHSLGMGVVTGVVAGLVGALVPAHFWPECMGEFEVAWLAVYLELSIILFARMIRKPLPTRRTAVMAGVWAGAGLLLAPNVLPVLLALLAVAFRLYGRKAVVWSAAAVSFAAFIISPWLMRNYSALGGFSFIRDNLGLELHISNNDVAYPDIERNMRTAVFQREHPYASAVAAGELKRKGELAFQREKLSAALAWIGGNRAAFAKLTAARVRNFWFPVLLRPYVRYWLWALDFAAIAGLLLLVRRNGSAAAILSSVLLTFPLIYYVIQNYLRYQHPIYWILLLLAAYAVTRYSSPRTTPST